MILPHSIYQAIEFTLNKTQQARTTLAFLVQGFVGSGSLNQNLMDISRACSQEGLRCLATGRATSNRAKILISTERESDNFTGQDPMTISRMRFQHVNGTTILRSRTSTTTFSLSSGTTVGYTNHATPRPLPLMWCRDANCSSRSVQRQPQRVVIAFRGHYLRPIAVERIASTAFGDVQFHCPCCSDYFASASNISRMLIEPLRTSGVIVSIVFHTYRSCPDLDMKLIEIMRPTRYKFSLTKHGKGTGKNTAPSYTLREALKLADEDRADAIILVRFDVQYKVLVTEFSVDWSKINIVQKVDHKKWGSKRWTDDRFFIIPSGYVSLFRQAVDEAARRDKYTHDLYRILGEIQPRHVDKIVNFMLQEYMTSGNSPQQKLMDISRACTAGGLRCMNMNTSAKAT